MASLDNNLTRLSNARDNIANAIVAKGGIVNSGDGFEDFPNDIGSIVSGITPIPLTPVTSGIINCDLNIITVDTTNYIYIFGYGEFYSSDRIYTAIFSYPQNITYPSDSFWMKVNTGHNAWGSCSINHSNHQMTFSFDAYIQYDCYVTESYLYTTKS